MNKSQQIREKQKMGLTDLDGWIDNYLTERFIQSGRSTLHVETKVFSAMDITPDKAVACLQYNGFLAKILCDDRPCATPYIEIIIPPQAE